MHTVFVSSTYMDLQPERSSVRDAILRLQCQFSGMEYFGSDPERPLRTSIEFVKHATIYVGIIAHRYGSLDCDTGKSITQLEYEEAKRHGLPTFIYFKDPRVLVEPISQYIDFSPELRQALEGFKEILLRDCTIQYFSSPDDLAAKMTSDIARHAMKIGSMVDDSRDKQKNRPSSLAGLHPILMLGPPMVGKTVYGCMLAHEPAATLYKKGFSIELGRDSTLLFDYYKCLRRGAWALPTPRGLAHSFEFILCKKKLFGSDKYNIRVLDSAGEEWSRLFDPEYTRFLHGPQLPTRLLPNIEKCSAIALFFDVDPTGDWRGNSDVYHANVVGLLARAAHSGVSQMPVAAIITKCDLVPDLLSGSRTPASYLAEKYPVASAQLKGRIKNYAVFGVSSTGQLEVDDKPPLRLEPVGIWEPILWLVGSLRGS